MYTLFISDLHLSPQYPKALGQLKRLLESLPNDVDALYILGDLFEAWVGEDTADPAEITVLKQLYTLSKRGVSIYFMAGNRDFLLDDATLLPYGIRALSDPTLISLYGTPTLLMHGDLLCTQDTGYLRYRKIVHHPFIQWLFKRLSPQTKRKIANRLRHQSRSEKKAIDPTRWDVTTDGIAQYFDLTPAYQLIHGHTHKPGIHTLTSKTNQPCQRVVLGDWDTKGSVLWCDADGNMDLRSC